MLHKNPTKRTFPRLTFLLLASLAPLRAADQPTPAPDPSRNPPQVLDASHPVEARVAELLGRMTLEEKIAQLRSAWVTSISSYTKVGGKVEISADYLRSLDGNGMGSLGSPLRADPWAGI
jgi:hypothetical protein